MLFSLNDDGMLASKVDDETKQWRDEFALTGSGLGARTFGTVPLSTAGRVASRKVCRAVFWLSVNRSFAEQ
jgi:hypothetical protein